MRSAVSYLFVFLLILAAGCSRDPISQSNRLVESGNKFYEKGKYKEASMQYRRAVSKYAKNAEAQYRLGLVSLKLPDIPSAVQAFRRALNEKPDNNDAAAKLADIYWMAYSSDRTKYKSLLPDIEELSNGILKRDPKSFDGLRLSGLVALAKVNPSAPDFTPVLARFEQANQIKPYQPEVGVSYFQTLFAAKRPDDAVKYAKEFISHQKNYPLMYDQLLMYYLAKNQYPEAEQILKDKVANNPKQAQFYLQLAGFYLGTKRPPEMESTFQRLTSNPGDFPMAHLMIGQFFFRLRDFDRARREFESGIQAAKDKAPYQKALVELNISQGKFQEARALVDQLLKDNPKDTQAVEYQASLRLQTGDPAQIQAAVQDLQTLVTKSPDNAIYHFELGRALMAKAGKESAGKGVIDPSKSTMALARVQFEESIRLRSEFAPAKLMLAQLYNNEKDPAKALQYADDVLRTDPNNLPARLSRTSALTMMGEIQKAKAELDQILKVSPNLADARFQLGMISFSEKKYKDADAIFRQLHESNPGDTRGIIGIVETQFAQNDLAGAMATMNVQLERDPENQEYHRALGNILTRAGRYDEAIRHFEFLSKKNPNSADVQSALAETYRLKGDINAAMDHFRKASQLDPNDSVPLIRMALILEGLGRKNEARPLYEQVLKIKADQPVALNNLAFIKAEEGTDLDQALSLAQRAKRVLPQDPNVADTLGWIYIKKNLSEDAVRIFNELVAKDPKNATYRLHYAMALFQKGDRSKAKKECETALQSNPSKEDAGKIHELMQKIG